MRYFIVAGEASGDLHASNLVKQLKKIDQEAIIEGWGGDLLKQQGVHIHKHIRELAFMGFIQVVQNLGKILSNFKQIKEQILSFKPDAVVLVDYPGFNLRLAKWLKEKQIQVIYYIAPQVWAWKPKRIQKIKKYVDRLLVILPFEKYYFESRGMPVFYGGHPILETIGPKTETENGIALLPGSREQEIASMLPKMIEVVPFFPAYSFYILKSPNVQEDFYSPYLSENVQLAANGIGGLMQKAKLALVTSGTATLETAMYEVPQIVCYQTGRLSYVLAKKLIKVPYISLVNLIAAKAIIPELIQHDFNNNNLIKTMNELLNNEMRRAEMIKCYKEIRSQLGNGDGSQKAAQEIVRYLNNKR